MPASSENFDSLAFCREKLVLGIPNKHPLANAKRISIEHLKGDRLLSLGRGHRLFGHVQWLCETIGALMLEDYEGTSLDALRQMVSIGMGLSLFPGAYIGSEVAKRPILRLWQSVICHWNARLVLPGANIQCDQVITVRFARKRLGPLFRWTVPSWLQLGEFNPECKLRLILNCNSHFFKC